MIDQSGFSTGYAGDLVVHDRKPMTGSRRLMVAGVVAAAAMSAFLQHGGQTSSSPGIPVPPPLPAPTPVQPLPSQGAVVQAEEPRLDGYWWSLPLTFEDIASNLRKRGYGRWVPALRDEWAMWIVVT